MMHNQNICKQEPGLPNPIWISSNEDI